MGSFDSQGSRSDFISTSPTSSGLGAVASGSPPLRLDAEGTELQRSRDVESVAPALGQDPNFNAEDSDYDDREVQEISSLLQHRMSGDQSGTVELLVHWAGENEEGATWEAEEEIQRGAGEMLYTYWKTQGGRQNVLFYKPKNPPVEMYYVFNILRHKMRRGGFHFEIQWVGHSTEPDETTMEPEPKLRKIAPELLDKYWRRAGGRASHLAARSRTEIL
ncbi:hypothetical protein F5B17DRAFT_444936 [Nemania serpens]|nr:hypothetical protein F5B17DRAFT_444936 [Nemania serpens]